MKRLFAGSLLAAALLFDPAFASAHDEGEPGHTHEEVHDEGHGGNAPHAVEWNFNTVEGAKLWGSIFNFTLLMTLLVLMGGPKIKAFLVGRKAGVETALNEAAEMKAKAEAKYAEYQKRLANLDNEIAEIRSEIVKSGEVERERILAEAEHKATRLRRDAEFLIEQQLKQLRLDLHKEMVEAALSAAEKTLREKTTADDQQRIARDFVRTMSPMNSDVPPRVTQMPMPPPPKLGRPPEGVNS